MSSPRPPRGAALLVLLLGTALLLPTSAHAATEEEITGAPAVPADVVAWFAERGPELVASSGGAVLEVPTVELEEVVVGRPVTVTTWAPGVLDGTSLDPPLTPLEQWVAPLTLEVVAEEATDAPTPQDTASATPDGEEPAEVTQMEIVEVGVLRARRGDTGEVTMGQITADAELAMVLRGPGRGLTVVRDEQTGGWFGYHDGTVRPLTDAAEQVLAGAVALETYQPFLVDRYTDTEPGAPPPDGSEAEAPAFPAPAWAAVLVVVLLAFTGAVVWIRRPEDEAEQAAPDRWALTLRDVLTLCLDTSGGSAVALVRDDAGAPAVLAEAAGPDPRRHAETLAPLVEQVLAEADLTRHDLDAVAVGTGPAPFTGLRVGLVTARALAHGLHIPVHGASSLDLLARQALDRLDEEDLEVLVVTDARRKEVYWARYRALGADDVLRVSGPEVASPAAVATQLLSDADAEVRVLGAGTELYADHLPPTPGLPARPDPAVLRRLVRTRLARAVAGDAVELGTEPLYLRRPDVQTPGAPKRATEQRA